MAKMVVIRTKPVRYPSGPTGKEYNLGDEFETLSERDTKALTLVRAAKEVSPESAVKQAKSAKTETKVLTAGEPTMFEGEPKLPSKRQYLRRDMTAEE